MYVRDLGRRTFFSFALFFAAILFLPLYARAADLSISPANGTVSTGKTISVQVMLDPGGESVNASDGTLSFDSKFLSVDSISRDGSAFSLWTADPSFSNSAGTITFSGGTPSAFSASKKVITIVFKGIAKGDAAIAFTKGSVLAADGKGTDVYKTGTGGIITVGAAAAAPPPDTSNEDTGDAVSDGATPIAPIINSSTHSKPDSWYGTSTAVFSWVLSGDVTAARTLISAKDNDTPKVIIKGGATSTETVYGIPDGVSYYYVQLKNDFGWGDTGKFKVQVDTIAPLDFSVALLQPGSDGGPPKLAFKTDDQLSGLDRYEVGIGTSTPLIVRAQDISDGTYPVPPNPGGPTHVTIRAYDKAGNMKETAADLTLPFVAKPKPITPASETPAPTSSGFGLMAVIITVLLAITIGALVMWNIYTRKIMRRQKEELLATVLEVRDKNDRIFSAIREEFEQLINNFDPKPQLTPEERAFLEEIKEVLDISEELVDTSIEDLKKMIRNQQ